MATRNYQTVQSVLERSAKTWRLAPDFVMGSWRSPHTQKIPVSPSGDNGVTLATQEQAFRGVIPPVMGMGWLCTDDQSDLPEVIGGQVMPTSPAE